METRLYLIKQKAQFFFSPIFSTFFSALNVSLRLVPESFAGRIEIQYNGIWRTVCDEGVNINTGHVICRELGYSKAVAVPCCNAFGVESGVSWLPGVDCRGNERNLAACHQREWKTKHCLKYSLASLVCKSPNTTLCESLRVRKAYDLHCFFKPSCFCHPVTCHYVFTDHFATAYWVVSVLCWANGQLSGLFEMTYLCVYPFKNWNYPGVSANLE